MYGSAPLYNPLPGTLTHGPNPLYVLLASLNRSSYLLKCVVREEKRSCCNVCCNVCRCVVSSAGRGEDSLSSSVQARAAVPVVFVPLLHHPVLQPGRIGRLRDVLFQPDRSHVHVSGPAAVHRGVPLRVPV